MNIFTNRQFRLPRIWSNQEIKKLAPMFKGNIVNISAWDDRDKEGSFYEKYFINAASYTITNFHGERGYKGDLNEISLDLSKDIDDKLINKYDVCFNHTTLEHIFDVNKAFSNICKMSNDIVIIVVPFSQEQHETSSFKDYWRFTPTCLRVLFIENGYETIYEAESPYSKAGIYLLFVASKRRKYWEDKMPNKNKIDISGTQLDRGIYEKTRKYFGKILNKIIV